MKSHNSPRELLIIRLICYSLIAWATTYVYLNSWTGLNVNKIEQERIERIQKKAALKKSLDILIEAGFSDRQVLDKQIELFTYFLGEKELDETKSALESMERTINSSSSLSIDERVKAKCLLIIGNQYLIDFQKASQIAIQSKLELEKAFKQKEIEKYEFDRLQATIDNNLAVTQFLQSGCEENIDLKRQTINKSITNFAKSEKLLCLDSTNKDRVSVIQDNLAAARYEILFDHD